MSLKTINFESISEAHVAKYLKAHSGSNKMEALRKTREDIVKEFENEIKVSLSTVPIPSNGTKGTILFLDQP
jgi:hypothetical protein